MNDADTIAAIATPPGVGAVAVIRLSGERAFAIAQTCFRPLRVGQARVAVLRRGWIHDPESREQIDEALAVHFVAPNSYTGEDLVEFHVHGGMGVVASSLALLLRLGARLAQPGEFTKRAFVHGRMDLAQAEAVADLIAAESERASKAAAHRLAGDLGKQLRALRGELLDRLVEIEAHVDYPDEVPEPDTVQLAASLQAQAERIAELLTGAGAALVLRDGIDCVIAGPPNAGKSSLLNALVRAERAIVSDVPGTTRDVIEERIAVDGVILRLRDTAGLRATADAIEAEGVARARTAVRDAQLVIAVIDVSKDLSGDDRIALEQTAAAQRILLANKMDLGARGVEELRAAARLGSATDEDVVIEGSVLWPQTIEALRTAIARRGWGGALDGSRALVANSRQIEALTRAREALEHARATIAATMPLDLVSSDLRDAVASLGEVTGDTVTEEVLTGIFSRFCVGK